MKALLCETIGPPENLVLREIEIPKPSGNQVLIKIHCTGINYRDCLIIEDKYQFKAQRPFAPCGEIAGEIVQIGENVTQFSIGDKVYGELTYGGLCQFIVSDCDKIEKIPDGISYENAIAMLINYGTSLYALKQKARIKKGEKLLVLGASGGVGIAALQLGKALGAKTYGAVSSEDKAKIALENGADEVFIYPKEIETEEAKIKLKQDFKNMAGNGCFDVIYDAIGGNYSEAALRAIAWNGRFLVIGFPSGIPKIPLNLLLVKGCEILGVFFTEFKEREPNEYDENVKQLVELLSNGSIKPLISQRYRLQDGAKAILAIKNRQNVGKIIVNNEII